MSLVSWIFGHVLGCVAPGGREVEAPSAVETSVEETRAPAGPDAVETSAGESRPPAAEASAAPGSEPARVESSSQPGSEVWKQSAAPAPSEPVYRDTLMWTNYFGVGGGARWGRWSKSGAADEPAREESTATGLGSLQARLAGYSSVKARVGGGLRFLTPELFASLELGGTHREGNAARPGGAVFGAQGVLRIGVGRSLATKVSPYGKLQLDQRFAVHYRDSAEGNHYLATLRGSAGILGHRHGTLAVMVGGALDGVAGVQHGAVVQAMAGGELGVYVHPVRRLSLAWIGDGRTTIAGASRGGRRLEGRATFDLMIGRAAPKGQVGYVSVFAQFTAMTIELPGAWRSGYSGLLGAGIGM